MKKRFLTVCGGMALFVTWVTPSIAEDKFQSFVAQNGKVVFSNVVDNSRAPISAMVTSTPLLRSTDPLHALIEAIAHNHGVDPALVKAIVKTESNFNRWAVSNKGARGLMQLIPGTGARFGVRDFFDPQQNIEGGVRYMKFLLAKFNGNVDLSLAAYNAGENLVQRLGRIPAIPETRDYVRKVRASYGKSPAPIAAGIKPPVNTVNTAPATVVVAKQESSQIYRTVDERGVVHFSNIAPSR